ncbi:hypothetical protein RM780_13345 [Streptomyces sp. DSM 44917]|uniref:SnoaL-like domain-containing protein n=1 Tax=Streptomyces boetiae TaxID=3075541 RepID=A0ABU2L9D3_9ACTN|nr:hypothetical protein [Streptomyces sp. DSM 44917]MDT0307942.1 hypothetical protein [Streptomyces sp. DSM 44917]
MLTTLRRNALLATALLLALAAVLAAAGASYAWYDAANEEDSSYAETRDEVLADAEQAVQNLNTLDYRDFDSGFDLWLQSSTGDLHEEFVNGRATLEEAVNEGQTVTTAEVLSSAVTELDERAGRAGVMVVIALTRDPADGDPVTSAQRIVAEMTRTEDGWKPNAAGQAIGNRTAE